MNKRLLAVVMVLAMIAAVLSGCDASPAAQTTAPTVAPAENTEVPGTESTPDAQGEPEVVLKLAHGMAENLAQSQAMAAFAESVFEKTNGAVRIDVYPNGQLGGERDLMDAMQLGTVDFAYISTAILTNFVPDFSLFDAPFLFNEDNIWKVCDGEIGQNLGQQLLDIQNIRLVGFMDVGSRNVFGTKSVEALADFSGIKIRVMENDIHIAMFNMLGAQATPMAWTELYTALEQGTVDCAENSLSGITGSGFDEICKYVTLTSHIYAVNGFCMSNLGYEKIPEAYRDIVMEEAWQCVVNERAAVAEQNTLALDQLKANGVTIYEIAQDEMYAAVAGVYEQLADKFPGDLIEQVKALG